jgi:hypothetical protein
MGQPAAHYYFNANLIILTEIISGSLARKLSSISSPSVKKCSKVHLTEFVSHDKPETSPELDSKSIIASCQCGSNKDISTLLLQNWFERLSHVSGLVHR